MRICHVSALVALLALVVGATAFGHADCPGVREYRLNGNYYLPDAPWVYQDGLQGQCDSAAALWDAAPASNGYELIGTTVTFINGGQGAQCTLDYKSLSNGQQFHPVWAVSSRVAVTCPPPPDECDGSATGKRFTKSLALSASAPDTICELDSHCVLNRAPVGACVGDNCLYTYVGSTDSCSGGGAAPDDPCVSGADMSLCKPKNAPADRNCGFVNGNDFVCIDAVKPGECKVLASGGSICGAAATSPPAPDNGTQGTPAEPDDKVVLTGANGQQTTYNYYNSTTVAGSSSPQGDGSDPYAEPPAGSQTDGTGAGDGLHCDPSTDSGCDGDGDGVGEADDPRDGWQCWAEGDGFKAAAQACVDSAATALYNGIMGGSSIVAIANATASAFPAGGSTCPSATVVLLDHTFDFWAVPCSFLDDVAGVLGPLFMLLWSIMGLRILLTIPGAD